MKGITCFAAGNVFSLAIGATVMGAVPMLLGVGVAIAVGICGFMADATLR